MLEFDEDKGNKKLKDPHKREEEEVAEMTASRNGLPYADLSFTPVNSDALRIIPEAEARASKIAAIDITDKKLTVAILSPSNPNVETALALLEKRGYELEKTVVSMISLEKAWSFYKDLSFATETKAGSLEISNDEIRKMMNEVRTKEDIKKLITDLLAQKKGFRISKILEIILAGALATKASDVHIEPEENYVRLRYRLDGVLNDVIMFDRETYTLLLSRVKLLSGMKLNIKKDSQDGRFSVKLDTLEIEIRASILPGAYDESIVLRILNPNSIAVPLEDLGIDPKLLAVLHHEISKPEGMLLTTGPTGSGKTTTLYAFLKKIHTPDIKIITIEDPIEYHLPGVVQTQTEEEKGYTFLSGLRSALRQDPDIIMIGEIRDSETAEIAINSALTGHLVFSTLHTNNSAGTFPRLIDLGVNAKVISSAMNASIAQRLLRKLCAKCRKEVSPDAKTAEFLKKIVDSITDPSYKKAVGQIFEPAGCEECNHTGYRGRTGVYEAILIDHAVEEVIISNPSERDIKIAAKPQALLDMRQDGVLKIISGITSLEELARVIDLEEEIV